MGMGIMELLGETKDHPRQYVRCSFFGCDFKEEILMFNLPDTKLLIAEHEKKLHVLCPCLEVRTYDSINRHVQAYNRSGDHPLANDDTLIVVARGQVVV